MAIVRIGSRSTDADAPAIAPEGTAGERRLGVDTTERTGSAFSIAGGGSTGLADEMMFSLSWCCCSGDGESRMPLFASRRPLGVSRPLLLLVDAFARFRRGVLGRELVMLLLVAVIKLEFAAFRIGVGRARRIR